jgi:hypothetical protein
MKKSTISLILIIFGCIASGQIVNNAIIRNDAGVYIVCPSNFKNDVNGTVQNNGNINVAGNFINNFNFTSGASSNVKLDGAVQNIGGTSPTTFNNLIIDGTGNKSISINTSVASSLIMNANKVLISNYNLSLLTSATIVNPDNSRYIVTNGTGSLIKKTLPQATDFLFPVGDTLTSYKPATIKYLGTTDTFAVRVEKGVNPPTSADPTCVLKTWVIKESNPGGTNASLTLGWNSVDQGAVFTGSAAMTWQNIGGTWTILSSTPGSFANAPATDWYHVTSGITDFSAANSRFIIRSYASPTIVKQPGPDNDCEGGNLTFDLFASGLQLTYQWQENCGSGWNNLSNNATYSGTTTNVLTITGATLLINGCQYRCVVTNDAGSITSNAATATVYAYPNAEAGTHGTYTGVPIQIGGLSSGPGTFSWSPSAGLSNPAISQPLASPATTTIYTLTVSNNGCIATDTVTIIFGGLGHVISGKTVYAGKANAGSPVPTLPTYSPVIYSISKVIVILKNFPTNDEVARDTSDANGIYQFTNIMDGNYILSYDKYTADTMMWCNDVNAIDVALMKYFIGSDTLQDPTRCFSTKYKKAANVDNNVSINAVDVARVKAKIGAPYDAIRNFPKGNWVAFDKSITLAGADLNVNLETISYGDYNASSSKYRDSTSSWSGAKSLPEEFVYSSDESISITNPSYFEVPLKINNKVKDFSALGLELTYLNSEYKLISAYMPGTKTKGTVKINPSLEEIIANDNDLLVTDDHGTIRVVYATTNHFDVAPNDEMIVLGFRPLKNLKPGELEFTLSGTGVIGNQFGEENEDTYLLMPKVMVQGDGMDAGFDFSGYPNPFNGEATITYNIPENGSVTLNVYNAIGELVTVLVNEKQESGKHSVVFSQKNLAAGMYTFKLEFSGVDISKNLILKLIH